MQTQFGSATIKIVKGSVLDQNVDAIVNAANTRMRGGGGIDGLIHQKAGRKMLEELVGKAPNGCPTGEAVITGGYSLKQPYVIHTPGPRYMDGRKGEDRLLHNCYISSLDKAEEKGLKSIAFCSISTGIYGYPIEEASRIALLAIRFWLLFHPHTSLKEISAACFAESEWIAYKQAFEEVCG